MKRRAHIPSAARYPSRRAPLLGPETTDQALLRMANEVATLTRELEGYRASETYAESERRRLAGLLWTRHRDEEFRPMSDDEARRMGFGT